MPLIEPHESMFQESDFTDITLQFVQEIYGPTVKDRLLLPGPVPLPIQHKLAANE